MNETVVLIKHKLDTMRNLGMLIRMNSDDSNSQSFKDASTIMEVADEAKELLIILSQKELKDGKEDSVTSI